MPQLHLYVPHEVAARLRDRARERDLSLSAYLAEVVQRETCTGWPEGYFDEVVGGWAGEPLQRPDAMEPEHRDEL